MGIDIYAWWRKPTEKERVARHRAWLSVTEGTNGYLREAYHGQPYATRYLCPEAFKDREGAKIPAAVLAERLPETLRIAEEREKTLYQSSPEEIEALKRSYRGFVALCERKEKETGEPVLVEAWW